MSQHLRPIICQRLLPPAIAVALALSASGCAATLYPDGYVEADYVPAHIETYPYTYYDGRPVYYVDGRWYYHSGPRWYYYSSPPRALYRHYYAPPAYRHERPQYHLGAHDYDRDREHHHRHYAPPARERRSIRVR